MTATVTFKGVDEVIERLGILIQTSHPELRKAMMNAAENTISARAAELCPVDTGNLRQSIQTRDVSEDSSVKITVGPRLENYTNDVYYAPYVEFGTYKMAAQPYLRPAFEEEKAACVEETAYNMGRWLGGIR